MLEFDEAAVRDALRQCGRQASMLGICADTIDSVAFAVDTQEVVISFHANNVLSVQKLRAEQLAALMIAFCCALRVPVPRRAEKRLDITPGGLRIRFVITVQTDRATEQGRRSARSGSTEPCRRLELTPASTCHTQRADLLFLRSPAEGLTLGGYAKQIKGQRTMAMIG